jgi:hypothetical protein
MRTGREPSESFPSALARPFPAGLAVFLLAVPRPFGAEVHPPSSFPAPSAFAFDRLPAVPFRALASRPPPGRPASAFPGISSLFAVVNRKQRWRGFPYLAPGILHGLPRWDPPFQALRPRRFARPRRLAPLPILRACFISLPRSGFLLQGFVPRCGFIPDFAGPFPSCRWAFEPAALTRSSSLAVDFRGLLPASSAVTCVSGENTPAPRPSRISLSSGLSVSSPGIPLRDASVFDLFRDEPTAPGP